MEPNKIQVEKHYSRQMRNPPSQKKKKKQAFVNIKAVSWKCNQGELFDYKAEKDNLFFQNFKFSKNTTIFRNYSNNITSIKEQQENQEINQNMKSALWKIKFLENEKAVAILPIGRQEQKPSENKETPQKNDVFIVIDSDKDNPDHLQGYNLQVGDIVKFGHATYLVYEINNQKKSKSIVQTQCSQKKKHIYRVQQSIDEKQQCRICYQTSHTQINPLINPCNCKGHSKYAHLQCIKPWVNQKVITIKQINGLVTTYQYDKFSCEVCTQKFPQIIKLVNEQEIFFLDFKKPERPYLLLKSLSAKQSQAKKLHFICPQNGMIKVGRSQKSDLVQTKQFTVSREHAQIEFKKGKFYIRDLSSKFGTLIKFHKRIQLQNKQQIRFQYKNTLYTIGMNKNIQSK